MNRTKERQTRRLSVGLSEEEYTKLRKAFAASKCKTLSAYGRRMLLRSPAARRGYGDSAATWTEELLRLGQALERAGDSLLRTSRQTGLQDVRNQENSYAALQLDRALLADKILQVKRCIQKIAER